MQGRVTVYRISGQIRQESCANAKGSRIAHLSYGKKIFTHFLEDRN